MESLRLWFFSSIDRIFASIWFTSSIFRKFTAFGTFSTQNICVRSDFLRFRFQRFFFYSYFGRSNDLHISKSYAVEKNAEQLNCRKCLAPRQIEKQSERIRIQKKRLQWQKWKNKTRAETKTKHIGYRLCECDAYTLNSSAKDSDLYASGAMYKRISKIERKHNGWMDEWIENGNFSEEFFASFLHVGAHFAKVTVCSNCCSYLVGWNFNDHNSFRMTSMNDGTQDWTKTKITGSTISFLCVIKIFVCLFIWTYTQTNIRILHI